MNVGERIKKRRRELGLSREELGERIGKARTTVMRYETGAIENMPSTVLEPIARALLTTPAYLMGWDDNPCDSQIVDKITAITRGGEKVQYDLTESEMQAVLTILDGMKKK